MIPVIAPVWAAGYCDPGGRGGEISVEIGRPIIPREHGAWAVIYGAFLAGVGVAGQVTLPVILFLLGITAATFANGPLTILVRSTPVWVPAERKRQALTWLLMYGGAAAAAFGPLLIVFRMTFLLPFGILAPFSCSCGPS